MNQHKMTPHRQRKTHPGKRSFLLLLSLTLLWSVFFSGCQKEPQPVSKTGFYFDTVITITLYESDSKALFQGCFDLAEKYEALFSRTREGSDVWNINHSQGQPVTVNPETFFLIQTALSYCESSQGAFDITIGALSDVWDFTSDTARLPDEAAIASALSTIDYHSLQLDSKHTTVTLTNPDARLDLGGIAKGYIADAMKEYLLSKRITRGIINLGGNVLCVGPKSEQNQDYTIAIQKPFSDDGSPIASVKLTDQSVVTSGTYQRYFEKDGTLYHHILDPATGYPCKNGLVSVTIISDSSVDGDALSTTCFLLGIEKGMAYAESLDHVEAVFITENNDILHTSGIGTSIPFTVY